MIIALAVLAALTLCAAQAAPKKPAPRSPKQYTVEQFYATIGVRDASFSSDQKRILFSSNQTGVYNVYSVPVAGGAPTNLTASATDTTYAVSYFPNDDRFLYTRDQGGNELNHLYVREPDGNEKDLTPGEKLKAEFKDWSSDRTAFWVQTNERDPRFFDLYRYDAKTYERTLAYKNGSGYEIGAIAPDGKWIALLKPNTTSDSDIYLWSAASNETKHITPHQGVADNSPQDFDPASGALYYLSNEGTEFSRIRRYDLATGKSEDVEKPSWDVLSSAFSKNGKYRITRINEDGRTVVRLWETASGKEVPLPKLQDADVTTVRFADSEKRIAFYANGSRSPSNLYTLELGSRAPVRLTDSLPKEIDPEDLVESEVVRFKSFDGIVIPSIYYKPHQASARNKVPAIVWVHGGPGDQTRKGWSATIQYLVNHGYAVLGINNRGSSGYGKSFYVADDKKHGKEPLWDCVEGKKYLARLPYVDPSRIAILGGSSGGYMVLAALAYEPEEFAVGV
ncbi:MAG TPA: prolyl oligopeptidase family serine peptidase, partial [Thermoanaerobaculia bacterium]|nr:prolyl oligopeptidase family serine peptidase [Thermoanaerobaculia bacterium]